MGRSLEKIEFEVIDPIWWDNWGTVVVAFRKGNICEGNGEFNEDGNLIYASAESPIYEGNGEFNEDGNLIYASAESPIYEGISDSIPVASIKVISRSGSA